MAGDRPLIELTFYETYYFANAVKNVLENRFDYLRHLDDFYGEMKYLALVRPFHKHSALHAFIEFLIDDVMSEEVSEIRIDVRQNRLDQFKNVPSALAFDPHPSKLPVNLALDRYEIDHESFEAWLTDQGKTFMQATDDDVSDYYDALREDGTWEQLLERATREVFFVLFQNRHVLLLFNDMIADQVKDNGDEALSGEHAEFFARAGILRRASIPEWVRRAVFFRDRGLCTLCHCDLTGIVNIWTSDNYDHIVPLASGGLNDVSNIQLLCRDCNSTKHAGAAETSNRYEAWYPED